MIIQINATVCAALDHGAGGSSRSLDSDQRRRVQRCREEASGQEKQEVEGEWQRRRFFRWSSDAIENPSPVHCRLPCWRPGNWLIVRIASE